MAILILSYYHIELKEWKRAALLEISKELKTAWSIAIRHAPQPDIEAMVESLAALMKRDEGGWETYDESARAVLKHLFGPFEAQKQNRPS